VASLRQTVEHELKLSAGADFELPELGGEAFPPRVFVSTYHDTSGHRLAHSGVTLRYRLENGRGLWQLKLPHGVARLELEREGPPRTPPADMLRLLPALLRGDGLAPVARLRTRRAGVRAQGAEIVHDSVAILDAQRVTGRFDELEVELLDGDVRALRRLEKALRRAGATDGEGRPKVFRALGIEGAGGPAGPPSDLPAGEALAAALRTQYTELLAHDPGTRLGSDPEDLHQLRVATRRLRAFLRAGRPLVDRDWADGLRDELAWLGGSLGPVRDLDVLIEHLRADLESLDDEDREAASTLLGELTKERRTARRRLLRALGSDRYLQLLDRVEAAAEPPLTAEADTGLRDIWQGEHKRLRKTVDALPAEPADDELHEVRIKVKRARYAGELAGLGGYVKAAKRLQDVLGEHQDAVVAEERLRGLAASLPDAALAAGRLVDRQRTRRAAARADWAGAWKRLAKQAKSA
jgi:CHAD domain-containing protein